MAVNREYFQGWKGQLEMNVTESIPFPNHKTLNGSEVQVVNPKWVLRQENPGGLPY
jgi:hypothetical protein